MSESHSHFKQSQGDGIKMTVTQTNKNHFKRFRDYLSKVERCVISSDGQSQVLLPKPNGEKPIQRKRKINAKRTLKRTTSINYSITN